MKITTANMSSIGSYVFFDIETTGLPNLDFGKSKITEMTLIGVPRSQFDIEPFAVPRVQNTLTLCLNPLNHISSTASKITGLTNDMLDTMESFSDKTVEMMISFIERLPQPACLISHNGNRFDFPILQAHLSSVNMSLPDSLLCGDSLKAFRDLAVMDKDPSEWKSACYSSDEISLVNETLLSTSLAIDEIENECKDKELKVMLSDNNDHLFSQIDEADILSQPGYSTPSKPINSQAQTPHKYSKSDVRTETSPKAKRSLFNNKSPSYKLVSVHRHVIGVDFDGAHSSQSDTLAMLKIVAAIGYPFHQWLQENSSLFSTIKKNW